MPNKTPWGPDSPGYLPSELLRRLIDYNPQSGEAVWRERTRDLFQTVAHMRAWNARRAGKPVGSIASHGYRKCTIFDRTFYVHRVVWAINYGEWPDVIDHINHNRLDNRIANLRSVTIGENAQNGGLLPSNKSGVCGVSWSAERGKWFAHIKVGGKMKGLGRYAGFQEAVAARRAAEISHGFHVNHGSPRIDAYLKGAS